MDFLDALVKKATNFRKRIVYPEGEDSRVLQAAIKAKNTGLCVPTLLGNQGKIGETANKLGLSLEGLEIIDPKTSPRTKEFSAVYYELRKSKGIRLEEAEEQSKDVMNFGALMVKRRLCDGMVGGAIHTTAETLRSAIRIIGPAEGIGTVSSFFLMILSRPTSAGDGVLIYADCGVVPYPSSQELAEIAITSANSARILLNRDPKVALLSFSTKGSATHDAVTKVQKALLIAKAKQPQLLIDGELQADAALVPAVAASKAPSSNVAGQANVLIFPNLDAGNIGYKMTERLAGAIALGPILQGLALPVNDLSRGCSAEDIFYVTAITCIQASVLGN